MNFPSFDRPLRAGEYADVLPGSLAVDFRLRRSQFRDLNAGDQLSSALQNAPADANRHATFQELPWPVKQFLATRAHEHDHVRRLLSTSFGFLCDSIRCLWLTHVGRHIGERASNSGQRLLPLRFASVSSELSFAAALEAIEIQSRNGAHTETIISGLANLLDSLMNNVNSSRFASALWALANGNRPMANLLGIALATSSEVGSAHPLLDNNGKRHSLSACHLLEFFAIGEHGNGFLRTGGHLDEVELLLRADTREYAMVILAWISLFGDIDLEDVESQSRASDDLVIDWYRLFPFELVVAADLALWPPFFPNEDLSIDGELNWGDIDPGRRFVRILAAFFEFGIQPTAIPATGRNERFLQLQERVCQKYGWPTPHALTTAWLGHLMAHLEANTSPWAILDGESRYRVANSIRLLALRLPRPADMVLNNLNFSDNGIEGSPIWIVREDDTERDRREAVPMGRGSNEILTPMFMMEGARHLLSLDRPPMTPVFSASFRNRGAKVLASSFSNHCDWSPEVCERFLAEVNRAFATHQS